MTDRRELLRRVAHREPAYKPDRAEQTEQREDRVLAPLTRRQREIVLLVSEGLSNKEVARRAGLTEGTVKIHLHSIFRKLGIRNRTSLATFAQRHSDAGT